MTAPVSTFKSHHCFFFLIRVLIKRYPLHSHTRRDGLIACVHVDVCFRVPFLLSCYNTAQSLTDNDHTMITPSRITNVPRHQLVCSTGVWYNGEVHRLGRCLSYRHCPASLLAVELSGARMELLASLRKAVSIL